MSTSRIRVVCAECGNEGVLADAYVAWDINHQTWLVENVFEKGGYCDECEGEARYTTIRIEEEKKRSD